MKQKRLETVCSFLDTLDKIIDIGCDHAYVSIEMASRGASKILATDIHSKALDIAKKNIENSNYSTNISCQLSDGLKSLDTKEYDTLVIAGMGASTIIHILSDSKKMQSITKLVLQSNNDLPKIRAYVNQLGYQLKNEQIVYERNHYYTVMLWQKGFSKLTKEQIEFGLYQKDNQNYYQDWYEKDRSLLNLIPKIKWKKRRQIKKRLKTLQKYLAN
ncbi:MAG: SAM-dependent methyltransferase [Bacilli bacterium]|nr:SAM-dependent methyltransferase [Bacilli bacterium]